MNATARPAMKLSGPQKAALVILGLDESIATEVLRHMDEADVARLAESVQKLDNLPVEQLDATFNDFVGRMSGPPTAPREGAAYVRKLAEAAMGPERAKRLLAPAPVTPAVEQLKAARAASLAELLAEEHPQIAAVVLAQLGREQGARVLMAMPAAKQEEVMARIVTIDEVPAHAAQMASETLAKALAGETTGEASQFDGLGFVAGLLNEIPPAESERLLGSLEMADAQIVPKVREKMFTFEDLLRLPARAIQMLMKEVTSDSLLIALKTASEPLRDHFLAALSSRAGQQLREDLQLLPPTRLSDVERAQREIVESAMRLGAEGRITMPGNSGDKLV